MAKALPSRNIWWKDVTRGSCVTVERGAFVVKTANNRKAVAYWSSQDAKEAQRYLNSMRRCKVR